MARFEGRDDLCRQVPLAGLGETAGDQDDGFGLVQGDDLRDRVPGPFGRDAHHRQIDLSGNILQAGHAAQAVDLLLLRMHDVEAVRIDGRRLAQVVHDHAAGVGALRADAHHQGGAGIEQVPDLGQGPRPGLPRSPGHETNAVDRDRTVPADDDRIDLQFLQNPVSVGGSGIGGREPAQPHDRIDQFGKRQRRCRVETGGLDHQGQDRIAAQDLSQMIPIEMRGREDQAAGAAGGLPVPFGEHAADADHDHGAERIVLPQAEQEFLAGTVRRVIHEGAGDDPFDPAPRDTSADLREEGVGRRQQGRIVDVFGLLDPDAAHVALVQDLPPDDLQHDPSPGRRQIPDVRHPGRAFGVRGPGPQHGVAAGRNADHRQQLIDLHLVQAGSPICTALAGAPEEGVNVFAIPRIDAYRISHLYPSLRYCVRIPARPRGSRNSNRPSGATSRVRPAAGISSPCRRRT